MTCLEENTVLKVKMAAAKRAHLLKIILCEIVVTCAWLEVCELFGKIPKPRLTEFPVYSEIWRSVLLTYEKTNTICVLEKNLSTRIITKENDVLCFVKFKERFMQWELLHKWHFWDVLKKEEAGFEPVSSLLAAVLSFIWENHMWYFKFGFF